MNMSNILICCLAKSQNHMSDSKPNLVDKVGKHLVIVQEPEVSDKLHVNLLKDLSGYDKMPPLEVGVGFDTLGSVR